MAVMFKKIKFNTHENLGWGKIHLPEIEMHTDAAWLDFDEEALERAYGKPMIGRLLYSMSYILRNISPIFTLSDSRDVRVHHENRSTFSGKPAVFIYDAMPGGVGISKRVYDILELIIEEACKSVSRCECRYGCPGCIGPLPESDAAAKKAIITLMKSLF
jgi:DEAD/DEAH box helicase domain-containing protein